MKNAVRTAFAALAVAALATAAFAADPIETRKATMKAMGGAMGGMVKTIRGEVPYDAAAAKAAGATLAEKSASIDVAALFPKGSETGGDTEALPKIWSDPADFAAALDKMKKTVATEAPKFDKGADAMKAAVAEIGKTCKGCHDEYRVKK